MQPLGATTSARLTRGGLTGRVFCCHHGAPHRQTPRSLVKSVGVASPGTATATSTSKAEFEHLQGRPDADTAAAAGLQVFSWTSHWWPVHPIESLDPKIPMHVDLLGKSLVVWGNGAGAWHCLEDKCPHRLAPLSEGRVEQGQIMCCYHGWTFSGTGACTSIPQLAGDSKAHASACSSKRSCVAAYPTRVAHGLLWVWPEAGPGAAEKAAATEPEALQHKGCTDWYVRDMPVRWDTLVENVSDPTHATFAHHGLLGNRHKAETHHWPNMTCQALDLQGTTAVTRMPGDKAMTIRFKAPFLMTYHYNPELPVVQGIAIPTKPGWSRVITNMPLVSRFLQNKPLWVQLLGRLAELRQRFTPYDHASFRNAILDGDNFTLHMAERLLPAGQGLGADVISRECYMPSSADVMVMSFRRWIQQFGGDIPTCTPADEAAMPGYLPKEQVIDRWSQHTRHCSHCLKALATLNKLQGAAAVVGLAAAVAFVAQAVAATALAGPAGIITPTALPTWAATAAPAVMGAAAWWQACQAAGLQQGLLVCGVLGVLCLGLYHLLADWRQEFYYKDYVHALK